MKCFVTSPLTLLAVAVSLIAAFIGCNRPVEQSPSTTPDPEQVAERADTVETTWSEMSFEQRATVMRERVIPEMTPLFREWRPEAFAVFTCGSCHGEGFMEINFRMPNGLPPLTVEGIMAMHESTDDETVATFQVMAEHVVPGMANVLGMERFDPATGQGFGCMHCHENASAIATP